MRLFINSEQVDLYEKERISYTKQVNSLKDLSSRQANFTRIFKVPRTKRNTRVFKGLGLIGSTSSVPYQKNISRLFIGNLCLIFTGWAVLEETTEEDYEINIFDGNIDFFKQLDNITFDDINLPELAHTKEVAGIKENWEVENDYYKYLLADFNGETHFIENGTTYINADYLIPSVPVKFLWERIFETFGFTFSGSVFQEEEFQNLFLTYPKGVVSGAVGNQAFKLTFPEAGIPKLGVDKPINLFFPNVFDGITNELTSGTIVNNTYNSNLKHWRCTEQGHYRVSVSGSLYGYVVFGGAQLYLGVNLHNTNVNDVVLDRDNLIVEAGPGKTEPIKWSKEVLMKVGDTLTPFYNRVWLGFKNFDQSKINFEFSVSRIDQTAIDQVEFFKNLTPKDFYKEILWRFGLTPFPVKDQNHIEFLTYKERIEGPVLDWSDRFVKNISEKYVYDDYAKNNYFRFKYNGEGEDFNDGVIRIDNENLKEKTDVINSKTFSVEKLPVPFQIGAVNVDVPKLQLWEKEVKNDGDQISIEYKPRDSRFSFVREGVVNQSAQLASKQLSQYAAVNQVRIVENYNYSQQQIVENRYSQIRGLFKNTLIVKAEIQMSESEFDAFDMKPTIYFKQLGGTFLVDKISKPDLNKKTTTVDLIKINK